MGNKSKLETVTAGKSGLHEAIKAAEWIRNSELKSTQKLVLYALASRIDKRGECYPQRKRIAEDTGLGLSTISKILGELENSGYITVRRKKHQKTGNLYFDRIVLNFPGPTPAKGTSLNLLGSVTPGPQVSDVEPITKQIRKDNYTKEIKLEDKKSSADLKVVCISDSKKESGKSRKNGSKKQYDEEIVTKADAAVSSNIYVMGEDDWVAVKAMVWWELFFPEVGNSQIATLLGDKPFPLNEKEIRLLKANELVSNYRKGCEKSPKARVAYWFAMRRNFYPSLPGSSSKKKLSPLDSKIFHEKIFGVLGPKACYVIAYMMMGWSDYLYRGFQKYPSIEDLATMVEGAEEEWVRKALFKVHCENEKRLSSLCNRLTPELML